MKRRRPSPKSPTSTTTSSRRAKSQAKKTTRKRSTDSSPGRERIAYLSLGSNRGGRRARIERALARIARSAPVLAISSYYRTEPVGFANQPEFLNVAAAVRWEGSPRGLLRLTQSVERAVGRRPSFANGPREIDVDVIDLGGLVRSSPDPVLPHPRLEGRRFVLAPLSEIAPGWTHPVTGRHVRDLLAALPRRPAVRKLSSRPRGPAGRDPAS